MLSIREEVMNAEFTKFHVDGAPLDLVFHRFTDALDLVAHDHPYPFISTILKGGYQELIYDLITREATEVIRKPGDTFRVEAETVHRILGLLDGECWTLIQPEPWKQRWRFFKFEQGKVYSQLPGEEWIEH